MDNMNKPDSRGHSPGSFATRVKAGEIKNPRGRPKGAKGVVAELRKIMLSKVDWVGEGQMTYIHAMVDAATRNAYKGNHQQLDLLLEMFVHISRVEQVRENTTEERQHRNDLQALLRIYEAHEHKIFELTDDEFSKLIKLIKSKKKDNPLRPIEDIFADVVAAAENKTGYSRSSINPF